MSDETNNPAHPSIPYMTLRDYFAARAMVIVMPPVLEEIRKCNTSDADVAKLMRVSTEACYGMADAMLEARK